MMTALLVAVAAGLITAAVLAATRHLAVPENRIALRQRMCRHAWKPRYLGEPGDAIVLLPTKSEVCRKCGAMR